MGEGGYYGALWEDLLLVTWLMGLLTKAPTFRIKMVSKRSCGEPHFPSLLFDTVSVSSLGEENRLISDSRHKQYGQMTCFTRLLNFSGFSPGIRRRITEISVLVPHLLQSWAQKGSGILVESDFCLKLDKNYLVQWKVAASWNMLFFWRWTFNFRMCMFTAVPVHHYYFFSNTVVTDLSGGEGKNQNCICHSGYEGSSLMHHDSHCQCD